jgi:hypothetical protein
MACCEVVALNAPPGGFDSSARPSTGTSATWWPVWKFLPSLRV